MTKPINPLITKFVERKGELTVEIGGHAVDLAGNLPMAILALRSAAQGLESMFRRDASAQDLEFFQQLDSIVREAGEHATGSVLADGHGRNAAGGQA